MQSTEIISGDRLKRTVIFSICIGSLRREVVIIQVAAITIADTWHCVTKYFIKYIIEILHDVFVVRPVTVTHIRHAKQYWR